MIRVRIKELRLEQARDANEKEEALTRMAEEVGIAYGTLQGLTSNTSKRVDFATVSKLCRYFNCTTGDLLEYVPDPEETT